MSFVSRVLFQVWIAPHLATNIPLGRSLPNASCSQPAGSGEQPSNACLCGLAPDGVFHAGDVTAAAVGSYPHLFTLAMAHFKAKGSMAVCFSVALSSAFPPPGVTRHHCSVELGLSSVIASY